MWRYTTSHSMIYSLLQHSEILVAQRREQAGVGDTFPDFPSEAVQCGVATSTAAAVEAVIVASTTARVDRGRLGL
jgi:hypothetical protein